MNLEPGWFKIKKLEEKNSTLQSTRMTLKWGSTEWNCPINQGFIRILFNELLRRGPVRPAVFPNFARSPKLPDTGTSASDQGWDLFKTIQQKYNKNKKKNTLWRDLECSFQNVAVVTSYLFFFKPQLSVTVPSVSHRFMTELYITKSGTTLKLFAEAIKTKTSRQADAFSQAPTMACPAGS